MTERQPKALTARELEALRLKAQGRTNDSIATAMGISVGRVEALLTHTRSKLRASSTRDAITKARNSGIL
jgi:DNA-binding CsgD family transcriptional regulator